MSIWIFGLETGVRNIWACVSYCVLLRHMLHCCVFEFVNYYISHIVCVCSMFVQLLYLIFRGWNEWKDSEISFLHSFEFVTTIIIIGKVYWWSGLMYDGWHETLTQVRAHISISCLLRQLWKCNRVFHSSPSQHMSDHFMHPKLNYFKFHY